MKKNISVLLIFILCAFVFFGCKGNTPKSIEADVPISWSVNYISRDAAVPVPLSEEDAAALEALLSSGAWIDDLTKCESDASLESSVGDRYDYHSECGTFNDRNSKRCLLLEDNDKDTCNDLLRKYGRLSIDDVTANADVLLTEPPVLTVRSSEGSFIEAMRGTTSWLYDNGDGTRSGMNADSPHPLNCKEYIPTLTLIPTTYSSKHPLEMFLNFDVAPDSVTVHCWSGEHWGDPSAESAPVELSSDIIEGGCTFIGRDGGYIYEVVAEWNSYEKFEGRAYYSFYAKPSEITFYPEMAYEFCAEYIRTNGYWEDASFPQVTVIDNREELDLYYDTNKARFDLERHEKVYADTTIGFLDACDQYDEEYFSQGRNLILITLEEPSGSIHHEVTEVRKVQSGWQVTIKRLAPETGTDDMAEWHVFLKIQMGNVITKDDDVSVVFSND